MNFLCKVLGHKYTVFKNSGIRDALAGDVVGDSYLDGNEEVIKPGARLSLGIPRRVLDREIVFRCKRCKRKETVVYWQEVEDRKNLTASKMLEILKERDND